MGPSAENQDRANSWGRDRVSRAVPRQRGGGRGAAARRQSPPPEREGSWALEPETQEAEGPQCLGCRAARAVALALCLSPWPSALLSGSVAMVGLLDYS